MKRKGILYVLMSLLLCFSFFGLTACGGGKNKGNGNNGNESENEHSYTGNVYTRVDENGNKSSSGKYILFGSYPQSEVTDSSLKSSLTSLAGTKPTASNSNGFISYKYYMDGSNTTDFMWYKDISFSGEKYRAVYFTSYRSNHTSYSTDKTSQDDNGYHTGNYYFFKYEPIKWRILTEESGKAFLMCDIAIDSQEYYSSKSSRTINGATVEANNYEHSSIRKWLNDTFYNTAFSALEKQIINLTTVDNSAGSTNPNNNATYWNDGTNKYACGNTNDYVFLLSEQEVTNSSYGFKETPGNYDTARRLKSTDYAKSQGCLLYTDSSYSGNCWWWLRSSHYSIVNFALCVHYGGDSSINIFVDGANDGVVPALWITL